MKKDTKKDAKKEAKGAARLVAKTIRKPQTVELAGLGAVSVTLTDKGTLVIRCAK